MGLEWNRVKGGEKPRVGQIVLLHSPQYEGFFDPITLGHWTGTEWACEEERDFSEYPPIHWAAVWWPIEEGDDDEWGIDEALFDDDGLALADQQDPA